MKSGSGRTPPAESKKADACHPLAPASAPHFRYWRRAGGPCASSSRIASWLERASSELLAVWPARYIDGPGGSITNKSESDTISLSTVLAVGHRNESRRTFWASLRAGILGNEASAAPAYRPISSSI